jgi:hypothetical protein
VSAEGDGAWLDRIEIEADQREAKPHGWRLRANRRNRYGRLIKSRER